MILQSVLKGLEAIKKYSELFTGATLIRQTESYSTDTGVNTITQETHVIKGIPENFNFTEIDDVKVLQNDMKFHVFVEDGLDFQSAVDLIQIDGLKYNIVAVRTTKLGPSNILYTLQLRV